LQKGGFAFAPELLYQCFGVRGNLSPQRFIEASFGYKPVE
jgi:hypothetical protein